MTEPTPTWPTDADYQKRLLAAYRLVYRAHTIVYVPETAVIQQTLNHLRGKMSDRTRLLASQWERKLWKEKA